MILPRSPDDVTIPILALIPTVSTLIHSIHSAETMKTNLDKRFKFIVPIITLFFAVQALAQDKDGQREKADFPESDIFLFEITLGEKQMTVTNGKNVTAKKGYENQPYFTPQSKSFLFSQADDYQTDVFEYFVESGETKRITNSPNMEFSPQPSPDNQTISFVTDGEGANQSIWQINRDNLSPVWTLRHLAEREPVGYYSWNHATDKILFWSRYGFNVRLVDTTEKPTHYVSGDAVPTSPQMIPKTDHFSFLHRQGNGQIWIKELNTETKAIRPLTPMVGNNTHYGWAPDGSIVMMEGSKLHRWHKNESDDGEWTEVADLQPHGIKSATRVNVSPDGKWLAVVGIPVPETDTKSK